MLKAVLFDLGDTLFDFEPMNTRAVFEESARATWNYLRGRGFNVPEFRPYFRMQFSAVKWAYFFAKIKRREFDTMRLLRRLCSRMNVPLEEENLPHLSWLCYEPLITHTTVDPQSIRTLDLLRKAGLKLAIISNTFVPPFALDKHLEMTGLLEYFPIRVYSSDVRYRKPDLRIFKIALDRVGVPAGQTMFIGDLVKIDIVGARRAGMITVLRQPFGNFRPHRLADYAIRRISELTQIIPGLDPLPA